MAVLLAFVTSCEGWLNSPDQAGFRWWLFSNFGAQNICPELMKRGMPLRMRDGGPAVGRFFPTNCSKTVDDANKVVQVTFFGTGYGFVMPARRISFTSGGTIEFRPDFNLYNGEIYLWGKFNRVVQGPSFQITYVENRIVDTGLGFGPLGGFANFLGNAVVSGEIARGFTVVHNSKGDAFSLGYLQPPSRPYEPWNIHGSNRYTFSNDSVELHANQRDYLGPFEVKDGKTLYVSATSRGPTVDLMVVDKQTSDFWRDGYQKDVMMPPTGPVLGGQPIYPNYPVNLSYRLPNGLYYVVVDNSATPGGVVAPPANVINPFGDSIANVSYLAQLGD